MTLNDKSPDNASNTNYTTNGIYSTRIRYLNNYILIFHRPVNFKNLIKLYRNDYNAHLKDFQPFKMRFSLNKNMPTSIE